MDLDPDLASVVDAVPGWAGKDVRAEVLGGGITNRNFRLDVDGESFVVRLSGRDTELLGIDREAERSASQAAHEAGVGPEVIAFLPKQRALITRFVEAQPLPAEDLEKPEVMAAVVEAIRSIHGMAPIPSAFDAFRVVREYRDTAEIHGVRVPATYRQALHAADRIAVAFGRQPVPIRPCHNDLLNANFLLRDDKVILVDYEYAGMGDLFFDLGNFSINNGISESARGAAPRSVLRRRGAGSARAPEADEDHVRLPRGDVGGRATGHLDAGLRLRGLRRPALRPVPAERGGRSLRDVARRRARGILSLDEARAIVIGGGVAGASIAYHLTELGWNDVLLVDRNELTSGSTFHSAGLVGQLRSSVTLTRMMMYGVELYRRLAEETGVDPAWHEVGSLRLASSKERIEELRRLAGWGQTFGLPLEIVSTARALELWPLFDPEGVEGAAYLPTDGYVDPNGLTFALAEGAKRRGATIWTDARVTGIDVDRGHVAGVRFEDREPVRTDVVVNAGGMYANQLGRLAGVEVPVVPFAHQYLLTKPIEGVRPDFPTMRDPDRLVYFRQEAGGGLVVGGYERNPAPWSWQDGPPDDFNHTLLPDDWDRFEPLAEGAFSLVPDLQKAEVVKMINGPEAFTPDGEFILGESDVRGFFVAAGFCAHGIAGAGGVGKVIAEWIVEGEPELDVWKMDIRRFGRHYASRRYALARAYEIYATYYDIHYPNEERHAGRPLKMAPTYGRLSDLGAEFGEKSGWERPNWFGSNEDERYEDAPAQRLGRRALVDGDRGRASRHPRARGPVRRVELREDRGRGRRRVRVPAAPLRERRRPRDRERGLHADAEPPGRHRIRCDGDPHLESSCSGSSPAPRSGTTTSRGSASTSTRMEAFGCAT